MRSPNRGLLKRSFVMLRVDYIRSSTSSFVHKRGPLVRLKIPQPGYIECHVIETSPGPGGNLARINIGAFHFETTNESPEFVVKESELSEPIPFRYGGFWDVPRYLLLGYRGKTLL